MLRYQEDNELHRDFHGGTDTAIRYISGKYGVEALKGILRKTGREVYKSIHDKLAKGNASELIEHLNWFMYREGAEYSLTVKDGEIRLEVFDCPAYRHLTQKLHRQPSEHFCLQTSEVNAGMCEGTPWESTVECLGNGHCIQIFRKKEQQK